MQTRIHTAALGVLALIAGFGLVYPNTSSAFVEVYTDVKLYKAALAEYGLTARSETFESEDVWGESRISLTDREASESVTAKGLTWTSNAERGDIATSEGAARGAGYGVLSNPHGTFTANEPKAFTHDGFVAQSTGKTLHAFGGFIHSNTYGAEIVYVLDGRVVELPNSRSIYGTFKFFGVIDTTGFTTFEVRETEGVMEETKYIFGDTFTWGVANDTMSLPQDTVVETPIVTAPTTETPATGTEEPVVAVQDGSAYVASELATHMGVYPTAVVLPIALDTIVSASSILSVVSDVDAKGLPQTTLTGITATGKSFTLVYTERMATVRGTYEEEVAIEDAFTLYSAQDDTFEVVLKVTN